MTTQRVTGTLLIRKVAVETTWILDIALKQDPSSQELFELATRHEIELFLPSFSIAEAVKALERIQHGWKTLRDDLQKAVRELKRSELTKAVTEELERAINALAQAHDQAESSFWPALENIVRVARIIEPTPEILKLTAEIRDNLKLSPADSEVLATVVSLKKAGQCSVFMSSDKGAFDNPPTQTYMRGEGITYYDNALPIVGPHRTSA